MTRHLRALRECHRNREQGATLVELLVAFGVFAMLLALVTAATLSMFQSSRKQAGMADALDASRKVVEMLDKQVRYANAITTPGTGASGATYVEWRTGNVGSQQQQYCTQWRYVPSTKQLQYRTWRPVIGSPGSYSNLSPAGGSFTTVASGVSAVSGTPMFSIAPISFSSTPPTPSPITREELTVAFTLTKGKPAQSQTSQVTLTADNSTSQNAPSPAVCTESVTGGNRP
jgi:Tfp pilus assembly protein PilE